MGRPVPSTLPSASATARPSTTEPLHLPFGIHGVVILLSQEKEGVLTSVTAG